MDLRNFLSSSSIYSGFQRLARRSTSNQLIRSRYLNFLSLSTRIVDIGCGPGSFLDRWSESVSEKNFMGIEPDASYVSRARRKYPGATFIQGTVAGLSSQVEERQFDLAVLSGVLHHISDNEVEEVKRFSARILKPGGYLFTVDPVLFDGQTKLSRRITQSDRGKFIRDELSYMALFEAPDFFRLVNYERSNQLSRLPISHCLTLSRRI